MTLVDIELPNAPSLGLLGLLFLVGYALYFTIYVFYTRFYHLRQFPGPSSGIVAAEGYEVGAKYRMGCTQRSYNERPRYLAKSPWDSLGLRMRFMRTNLITERGRSKHNALRYQMASGYGDKDIV
ncbi:uncharacterized protein Bfra_001035 [Botrytis fragariae]|uniref:Uncharacterized protein n=1 Tax=Botrytis fragariae TaxID=1964551 RepID=A0A8H6ENQ2_9HELO|nr:uncharacterized protein Bfra_001035 [Botrytis fragariae]KAF5878864.1 hypothetical protein Bfra_001035 [Botrytis fragariae]